MILNLELIKQKRNERGLSIDEMAEKLSLTNGSMYWKREAGQYKFKPEELAVLSKVLRIPMTRLFLSKPYSKTEINKSVV